MAIFTPLQGTGGMSDTTINAMLQSGDPNLVKQANDYIAAREQEIKERGADKGILGVISDLFGFSKLAAAEPDMPNSQEFSEQLRKEQADIYDSGQRYSDQLAPGPYGIVKIDDRMFNDYFATNRYEDFSPRVGVLTSPQVQDVPVDLEELGAPFPVEEYFQDDIIEQQLAAASRGEGETFFDRLKDIGGNVLDYIKGGGIIGKGITSLANFRDAIGTRLGPASYGTSQAAFNAMTPSQQRAVGSIYGPGGIMQGYNAVSAFGRGPIGSIQNRIDNILGRKAAQTAASRQKLADLKNALTNLGGGGDSDAGYSPGQDAGMGFGGGRSDPTDKS